MIVGTLRVRMSLREARSLKDKRRVVLGLKDRIRERFQVAVAEVDLQDAHQQIVLGIATVGNERRHVNSVLSHTVDFLRGAGPAILVDYDLEMW